MIYREFLERFGIHLFPFSTPFREIDLGDGGWAWWNAQSFRDEGLCRNKETGEFHRFTMWTEMMGNEGRKLKIARYTLGASLGKEVS